MNYQPTLPPGEYAQVAIDPQTAVGFSVADLIRILRRRLVLILATIATITALGTLVTFQLTPKYRAEAVLILDSRKQQIANIQDVVSGLSTDNSALRSELDVLTSRPLAGKVIDKLNLMADPEFNPALQPPTPVIGSLLGWLGYGQASDLSAGKTPDQVWADTRTRAIDAYLKKMIVTTDGRSLTLKIAMDSVKPDLAAKIVNTHSDLYLLDQLEARFDATKRANAWLTDRVAEVKAEVSKDDDAVEQFRQKYQIITSDRGGTIVSQQLAELNSQLVQAQAERDQAEARLQQVRSLVSTNASVDSIPEVLASQTIMALRAQEAQLVETEAQLASKYQDVHPTLINARAQLNDVQAKIRTEINKVVVSLEQTVASANNKVRALQAAVDGLTQKVSDMNISEVHLRELQREADASQTLFQNLLGQFMQTSGGPSMENSDARVVSPADTPLKPNFPKKTFFIPASFLLGVIIALGFTALLEALDNGFRSPDQIERQSGVSGLGMLPALSARVLAGIQPADVIVKKPLSSFSEAVRSIRTALFHSNVDKPPKLILVTSAVPAEGKTVVSISLARSAAISGHKTLLIDADYRRPGIGAALGGDKAEISIADFVAKMKDFDALIKRDALTGLDYFPAPSGVTNSLDLLSSQQFSKLLEAVRARYDFVFLDSPPVLGVADTLMLAPLVDTVVYVVRWEKTPQQVVLGALKSLRGANVTIAGSVLSRVNVKRHMRYGYGDHGYYYGRYGTYYSK
jgi:succinoglycan biosynthesis transport protein ExoP